jgi:hypothetical protein
VIVAHKTIGRERQESYAWEVGDGRSMADDEMVDASDGDMGGDA